MPKSIAESASEESILNASTIASPTLCFENVPILPGISLPVAFSTQQLCDQLHDLWAGTRQAILIPKESAKVGCLVTLIAFDSNAEFAQFQGIRRVRLQENASIIPSQEAISLSNRANLRKRLIAAFLECYPELSENSLVSPLWERELSFGALCDLFAAACQLEGSEYEVILNELDEESRCERVLRMLKPERLERKSLEFPLSFSLN